MFERLKERRRIERNLDNLDKLLIGIIHKYGKQVFIYDEYYSPKSEEIIYKYVDDCIEIEYSKSVYFSNRYLSCKYNGKRYSKSNCYPVNGTFGRREGINILDENVIEYLKSIPSKVREREIKEAEILRKKEAERIKEQAILDKKNQIMRDAAERSKHVINAIAYIKEYEDNEIKVDVDWDSTFSSEDGTEYYVKRIDLIWKNKNAIVFSENNYYGQYVSVYRPGKWEEYLLKIYKTKLIEAENERKKRELKEKQEKQKQLKFERERYLPIN